MIKAHYLQHVPFENPAYIFNILDELNIPIKGTLLYIGNAFPQMDEFDLLIVMGGPMGVHDEKAHTYLKQEKIFIEAAINEGKKIVGICLGAQLIADVLGAKVYKNRHKEIGWFPVNKMAHIDDLDSVEKILPRSFYAFHWHGDTFDIPKGSIHLAESEACTNQAFIYDNRVLGMQFHLESTENSILNLYNNCKNEIDDSDYVQEKTQILDTEKIPHSNKLMKMIMNEMITK